ncbi:MAG: hypothetical protein OXL36_18030 [Bryobacterales bacterium]|nr:hypothetical protein [Bryobacterales bacterium]
MLWPSGLLGLAAAILFLYNSSPSHFMDMALSAIIIFVGVSCIAAVFIFLALMFYDIFMRLLSSDN